MAETVKNNTANVSAGKAVKGGYAFVAPVGTTLPTTFVKSADELDAAFKNLGFISEDGYVESIEEDSDDIVDMNGTPMDTSFSNRAESAQVTFAEIKADTLKVQYGDANVTDEAGVITVKHNGDSHPYFSYVFLFQLKNGRMFTKVIPEAQTAELDDLTVTSSELCQRAMTMKFLADGEGNTTYDYFESTETTATQSNTKSTKAAAA